jgi:hypothetical protein
MSDNSLTAAISLGVQSGKGSAATAYKTALATDSSGNVKFDTRDPKLEHPSAIARSTKVKIAQQRVETPQIIAFDFDDHHVILVALKAIEVAETLCSLVPYSNITLQNIKPGIMPKDFAPHGADCLKKEYVNGSTLFVYLLPF